MSNKYIGGMNRRLKYFVMMASAIILLGACDFPTPNQSKQTDYTRLEKFVLKWINENPNWMKNEVACDEINKAFKASFCDSIKNNPHFLEDSKFYLHRVSTYRDDKCILWLSYSNSDSHSNDSQYDTVPISISGYVVGIVDKKQAVNLGTDLNYQFGGEFVKELSERQFYSYFNNGFPPTTIGYVIQDLPYSHEFLIGSLLFNIDTIYLYSKY